MGRSSALDIADDENETKAFNALTGDARLFKLAERTMQSKRCTNCHELKLQGQEKQWAARPAKADFAAIANKHTGGCLADKPERAEVPSFAGLDRPAVTAFLTAAHQAPGTPAPGEFARITLQRFNCTGCHERNATGGLQPTMVDTLFKSLPPNTPLDSEAVSPPPLTGVVDKLLIPYIDAVLLQGRRSRPWMTLQMPRFNPKTLENLSRGLSALDGDVAQTSPVVMTFDANLAKSGRTLIGEGGFGCIKCHDMLGIESGGTRGPDLSQMAERVNYDWYRRWMTDPQRIHPGTRMPTVFLKGESPYKDILSGAPDQQKTAIWQYLLVSKRYPYPEGLQERKAVHVPATEGPLVIRSFLPNTSARGVAIRFPDGVHLAFDAQKIAGCRMPGPVGSWT